MTKKDNRLLSKYGPWALVTGASSGIGEEFCRQLAAKKFNLVMVARRTERLNSLKIELENQNAVEIKVVSVDLTASAFLHDIIKATITLDIGLLINNAGFALTGNFLENSLEDELSMLDLNCRTPIILAHYFGNKMVAKKSGGIINVSSVTAFLPMPFRTNYSSSKVHNMYFSQGLWFELKHHGIDVLTLCPGATKTEFAEIAGTRHGGMSPVAVVNIALKKLGNKSLVIAGVNNKLVAFATRFIPNQLLVRIGAVIVKRLKAQA